MVQTLRAAERAFLACDRDLVGVRRVEDRDRRDRLRFRRRHRTLLHTHRQPLRETRQQPAQDEIDDTGDDECLQNVEIHRAESARFLQQVGVHDDRAERRVLEHDDELRDGGRQHRVDRLRHLDAQQRLRARQTERDSRLMLSVRQVADARTHKFGDNGTVVQHKREDDRPIRGARQVHEREPAPEEDHHDEDGDGTAELDDDAAHAAHDRVRNETAHTEEQAEHDGADHGEERRAQCRP